MVDLITGATLVSDRSVNVSLFVDHPQVHYTSVSQLRCITKTVQLHGLYFDILVVVASGNVARQRELQLSPPLVKLLVAQEHPMLSSPPTGAAEVS